jgi:hypothetical protein
MRDPANNIPVWPRLLVSLAVAFLVMTVAVIGMLSFFPGGPRIRRTFEDSAGFGVEQFSADGRLLLGRALGWRHNDYVVWEVSTGRQIDHFRHDVEGRVPAFFTPNRQIACMALDEERYKQSLGATGKGVLTGQFMLHDSITRKGVASPVRGLALEGPMAISADEAIVAGLDWLGRLRVWDIATGDIRVTLPTAHPVGWRTDLRFSRDGRTLGAAFPEGTVQLWNVADWNECVHITLADSDRPLLCELSPDLRRVLTCPDEQASLGVREKFSTRQPVRLWSLIPQEQIAEQQGQFAREAPGGNTLSVRLHVDGRVLIQDQVPRQYSRWRFGASSGADYEMDLIWRDLDSGQIVATIPRPGVGLLSPDCRVFAEQTSQRTIALWDLPRPPSKISLLLFTGTPALVVGLGVWRLAFPRASRSRKPNGK